MSGRLPVVTARHKGGHALFRRESDGARLVIPMHSDDVPIGTLRGIIEDMGITPGQFRDLLWPGSRRITMVPAMDWVAAARRLGAAEAKIIAPATVITAPWVRLKCQYGCGGWGRRLTCPPYSPTPEQTRAVLDCYTAAILVHIPGGGQWRSVKQIVANLEREAFLAGHYKAFGFGSGPCDLCEECNLEHCLHPSQARPAMEAAGIDVYATARGNGFPIEVVKDHTCPQNYYGLVLVE